MYCLVHTLADVQSDVKVLWAKGPIICVRLMDLAYLEGSDAL